MSRDEQMKRMPPRPAQNSNPDEPMRNRSDNPTLASILATRLSRRQVLKGSLNAVVASMMLGPAGAALAPIGGRHHLARPRDGASAFVRDGVLGFDAIPVSFADGVTVPPGYRAEPFIPWGTPILANEQGSFPPYLEGGANSAADQEHQIGYNHDGMHYFPLDTGPGGSARGLLCINHEYVDQYNLLPNGPTFDAGGNRPPEEVRKEVAAHGVAIVEIRKDWPDGRWVVVEGSRFNRRITANTPMELSGPVRGSRLVQTRYSPGGTRARGTVNNCAYGFTPWGTYLTCEENFQNYFVYQHDAPQPREQARYGVPTTPGSFASYWWTVEGYERFNATPTGDSATRDFRNEANTFGWVVEIDPFNPASVPRKRTALGRFRHEGAWMAPAVPGEPLTVYMGDDQVFEYIYKFVTRQRYYPETASGELLDEGTLYVARFNEDGSGDWIALELDDPAFRAAAVAAGVTFADQADVLVNARTAADVAGATKMDRPEWGTVNPRNHEVYMALTNNYDRQEATAPNPRAPNQYGQIIRWREEGDRNWATRFHWELFVVAGPQDDSSMLDGEPLDESSIFNSPDGLWFDHNGILWIQTDGDQGEPFGNNQMLAADPQTGEIRRFFTGARGSEVTGVDLTPDGRTMFVNVQHPGNDWPDGGGARPRPSTVVITREDGGVIGLRDRDRGRDAARDD